MSVSSTPQAGAAGSPLAPGDVSPSAPDNPQGGWPADATGVRYFVHSTPVPGIGTAEQPDRGVYYLRIPYGRAFGVFTDSRADLTWFNTWESAHAALEAWQRRYRSFHPTIAAMAVVGSAPVPSSSPSSAASEGR